MQPPNVYSSHYRFLDFRGGGNLLRISRDADYTAKIQPSPRSNPRDRARLTATHHRASV